MNVYKVVMVGVNSSFSGMALKQAQNPQLALNMAIREMPQELWGSLDTVTVTCLGPVNPADQPRILTR
jgi:hypothetical protein